MSKPILIYDGHCNMCITTVKSLEPFNREGETYKVNFVPFQKAAAVVEQYGLNPDELQAALHLITPEGRVFKAGAAFDALADYFPLLKIGSGFWTTSLGESIYAIIAKNRYDLFGCTDECYVSEFYESPQVSKQT
jgi:predicted DCC family thiol-disulfide oxidoreductase YuxK